jgi:hypothetical protein
MIRVQKQPLEENSPQEVTIVRLTLYPSQAKQFWPLLADALKRTGGIHGVQAFGPPPAPGYMPEIPPVGS